MMAAEDGAGEKTQSPWCLAIARYVAAAVVTVFLFMFIVRAVVVVLRPAKLNLWVQHGSVSVDLSPWTSPTNLTFHVNLIATNPSGRAGIYFNNNTIRVVRLPQSGRSPWKLLNGSVNPIYVSPGSYSYIAVNYRKKSVMGVPRDDLGALGNGSSFPASVQVDAFLSYKIGRRDEAGGHDITYYCSPVVVVAAVNGSSQDNPGRHVPCSTNKD